MPAHLRRALSLLDGQFSKDRSLSAYPLLVGLELPAGEFVAPVPYLLERAARPFTGAPVSIRGVLAEPSSKR